MDNPVPRDRQVARNAPGDLVIDVRAIMTFVCILALALLSCQRDSAMITDESEKKMCLRCDLLDLKGQSALLNKLTRVQGGGIENCCAYNPEQMSALKDLVEHTVNTKQESPLEDLPEISASAHKIVGHIRSGREPNDDNPSDLNPGPGRNLVFTEEDKFSHIEHAQGVEVLPSGYRISKPGIYHIYSSLHFRSLSSDKCQELPNKTWRHAVVRIRPGPPQERLTLLEKVHNCMDELDMVSYTTYTNGAFQLEIGDVIGVEDPDYAMLEDTGETNFLGLFLMVTPQAKTQQ